MDINYIKEFVILSHIGNYLKAADELFISQSALSRHIQCVEADLGAQLFSRTTRRIELTDFGKLFLPFAQEITQIQTKYKDAIDNKQKSIENSIVIGYTTIISDFNVSDILSKFQQNNPKYRLNIIEGPSSKIVDMVQNGTCDFAFTWKTEYLQHDSAIIPFANDTIVAILPSNHPLAKHHSIQQEQLPSIDRLFLPKDPILNTIIRSKYQESDVHSKYQESDMIGYSYSTQIDFVGKHMGIAVLNKNAALALANPGIAIVDILPEIDVAYSLIYSKSKGLNTASFQFLKYVMSCLPRNYNNITHIKNNIMPLQGLRMTQ